MDAQELKPEETGLRERKKLKRRQELLEASKQLFGSRGIESTTMADIAGEVGVSVPTVVNYFGSKEAILLAIISEGVSKAYDDRAVLAEMRLDAPLVDNMVDIFCQVTTATLAIAPRRIWRFAEAATIRHPDTQLAKDYMAMEARLIAALANLLGRYEFRFLAPQAPDMTDLVRIFHSCWNMSFFTLIKNEDLGLEDLRAELTEKFTVMCNLIFADGSVTRKPTPKD
jgi:AcrR family transcriptional regulator